MQRPSPREILETSDVSAFLITDRYNIRYLTGVPLENGYVLVTPKRCILFVDDLSRYTADTTVRSGIVVRSITDLPKFMADVGACGYEADRVAVLHRAHWKKKFPETAFVRKGDSLKNFRRQKQPDELRNLRRALQITEEVLRRVPSMLRRKITEEKLARQLQIWALELGADGMAFDPIVAFGTNTGCPHHVPTARLLRRGHLVQIDVGAKFRGYCADMSEVFFTARPTESQKRMIALVREAAAAAIGEVKSGASTKALDEIARKIFRREGLEEAFVHSLGHGVGLEIHEGVSLSSKKPDVALLPHEVITIEPGLYFPGRWGMRVERMVVVQ